MRCAIIQSLTFVLCILETSSSLSSVARSSGEASTNVSPVTKVLSMLGDLLTKAKTEKDGETTQFSQFFQLCKSLREEKSRNIEDSKMAIVQLEAASQKASTDAMNLAKTIHDLDADLSEIQADTKRAEALRAKGKAHYQSEHHEYGASIASAEQAIQMINQGNSLVKSSLLDLTSRRHATSSERNAIMSMLQQSSPEASMVQDYLTVSTAVSAPEANVFESSSGSMLDMVEQMADKFRSAKIQIEKEERDAVFAHQMTVQVLSDRRDSTSKERDMTTVSKTQREQAKAEAESDLASTQANLAEDEKLFSDNNADCERKSDEYEKKQGLRSAEITALKKALEIIGGAQVAGTGADQYRLSTAFGLAQLRSSASSQSQSRQQRVSDAATFLDGLARKNGSRVLALISLKVGHEPFKKVSEMIKAMIAKLMEEATEEADHKGFCDTELKQNKLTRAAKTEQSDALHAAIDQLSAAAQKLADEISDVSAAILAINEAVQTATKLRHQESARNTATIQEATAAQEAVASAITVLRDFYEAPSFAQTSAGSAAEPSDASDLGQQFQSYVEIKPVAQDSKAILGLLDVIASDFARLETETKTAELDAQRTFTKFINNSSQDKDVKSAELDYKTSAKQDKSSALAKATRDLKDVSEELAAGMEYLEKLKPSCVNSEADYEDRVQSRKEEIEALKEALNIMNGDDIAF